MKIGIFGGSFNPIHIGHAIIANYIISNSDLDKLLMMVAPRNPMKPDGFYQVSDGDRLRMVELVARRLQNVYTSAFEFEMPTPSYTINTLNAIQARFPEDEFYLVIGADNWAIFDRWKEADKILSNYHVIIYPRSGYEVVIPEELAERVQLVNAPIVELSSTEIREGLKQGQNMSFYLPVEVYDYITRNELYLPQPE